MVLVCQWGVKDSNLRRQSHQIYSLTPLTTRETPLFLIAAVTAGPVLSSLVFVNLSRASGTS